MKFFLTVFVINFVFLAIIDFIRGAPIHIVTIFFVAIGAASLVFLLTEETKGESNE